MGQKEYQSYLESLSQDQSALAADATSESLLNAPVTPEDAATGVKIAPELGVTPAQVAIDAPVWTEMLKRQKTAQDLAGAPATRDWLNSDPINGAIAADDTANLSWWEKLLQGSAQGYIDVGKVVDDTPVGRAVRRTGVRIAAFPDLAKMQAGAAILGDIGMSQEAILADEMAKAGGPNAPAFMRINAQQVAKLRFDNAQNTTLDEVTTKAVKAAVDFNTAMDSLKQLPNSDAATRWMDGPLARVFSEQTAMSDIGGVQKALEITKKFGAAVWEDPLGASAFFAETGIEFAPILAAAAVATATTGPIGGAVVTGAGSFTVTAVSEAKQMLEQSGIDVSTPEAAAAALKNPELMGKATSTAMRKALVVAIFDALSFGIAGKEISSIKAVDIGAQTTVQATLGASGEVLGNVATGQKVDVTNALIEAAAEVFGAPIEIISSRAGSGRRQAIDNAGATKQLLGRVDEMATASKTRGRSPDKFAEALNAQGGDQAMLYVPADDMKELFQSKGITPDDAVLEPFGLTLDQYDEAVASGGDLSISMTTYATKISGSDNATWFGEHATMSPDEVSLAGASAARAEMNDIMSFANQEVARMEAEGATISAADQAIYDDMYGQLRNAGRAPRVAEHEAKIWTSFWRTMGTRYGTDPLELAAMMGVKVAGPAEVSAPAEVTSALAAIRTAPDLFAPTDPQAPPVSPTGPQSAPDVQSAQAAPQAPQAPGSAPVAPTAPAAPTAGAAPQAPAAPQDASAPSVATSAPAQPEAPQAPQVPQAPAGDIAAQVSDAIDAVVQAVAPEQPAAPAFPAEWDQTTVAIAQDMQRLGLDPATMTDGQIITALRDAYAAEDAKGRTLGQAAGPKAKTADPSAMDAANQEGARVDFSQLPAVSRDDIAAEIADNNDSLKEFSLDGTRPEYIEELFRETDGVVFRTRDMLISDISGFRRDTSDKAVGAYREMLREGKEAPPILVDGNRFVDGGHRLAAYKAEGRDTIPVVDIGDARSADFTDFIETADAPFPVKFSAQPNGSDASVGSAAFRQWFGDSKIVDGAGAPLVMYHGTLAPRFDAFDMNKTEVGANFFTESSDHAAFFAGFNGGRRGGRIMEVYLSIKNPMVISQADLEDAISEAEASDGLLPMDVLPEFIDRAKAAGHDGLIVNGFADIGKENNIALPFSPSQIKSVDNAGGFDQTDPRILNQSARRQPAATGEATGVDMPTSLAKAFEMAQAKKYTKGRELKADLQAASLAAQAEAGVDLTTLAPENIDRLADFAYEDALEAIQDNANAIGWYDRTITAALEHIAELHPEILTEPASRLQFIWALAVTSNGLKVDKNFEIALNAYEALKASGGEAFPTGFGIGQAAAGIESGLAMYATMLAKFGGDHAALTEFMNSKVPVRDIEREYGVKISGEGKGAMVRGASILGPKIGNGFFSNLYGNFDELTMDRWLMRSVGRWRGTLIAENPEMVAKKRGEIKGAMAAATSAERAEIRKLYAGSGVTISPSMTRAQIDALAVETQKLSIEPKWRAAINRLAGGEDLRKAGNALAKYLDGQVEAPAGANERAFIRKVFKKALDRLQESDAVRQASNEALTMSDLQALLWYPEKRLYDTAKQTDGGSRGYQDDEAPDYANAARNLVRDRLGRAQQGDQGAVRRDAGSGGQRSAANDGSQLGASTTLYQSKKNPVDGRGAESGGDPGSPLGGGQHVVDLAGYEGRPRLASREEFDAAMQAAASGLGAVAAQVSTVPADSTAQRILLDDGLTGFALDGDNVIGVFSSRGSKGGAAQRVLDAAVAMGGRRLDGFNTYLPKLYANGGFRAVARVAFDPAYAPTVANGALTDWDAAAMEAIRPGWGAPDIAFMVYDPANASATTDVVVPDYEAGQAAQQAALDEIDARPSQGGHRELFQATERPQDNRGSIELPGGGVASAETVINLFETADLSTFTHESGHFFLEAFTALASNPDAPEQMRADLAKIQKYLGAEAGKGYTTDQHETWARSWEAYVMGSEAPSLELAGAFSLMRQWLTAIYKSLASLKVNVTPEITEVMDRMIASDDEIAAARADTGMDPLFKDAPTGMSQADWDAYNRLAQRAQDRAEASLLAKVMKAVRRRREAWFKAERKATRARVADEINQVPVYRLIELMANQRWFGEADIGDVSNIRIDRDALVEQFGEGILAEIDRKVVGGKRAIYGPGGITPQEAADLFGFPNAGQMIDAIKVAGKRNEVIDAATDAEMTSVHGDIMSDGSMEEEALAIIHSDSQAEVIATEARTMGKSLGKRPQDVRTKAVKLRAKAMIARMRVRDASASARFLAAERKAARKAQTAFAKVAREGANGRAAMAEAYQAKEQQLLNLYLYREARAVEREVASGRERMQRYARKTVRAKLSAMYLEQIDAILTRFDFRKRSAADVQRSQTLADWVKAMQDAGRESEIAVDPRMINEAMRQHYMTLTVDELRGLFDTIKNIDHMGRHAQELINGEKRRLFGQVVDTVTSAIHANLGVKKSRKKNPIRSFMDLLYTADRILGEIDGFDEYGDVYAAIKEEIDAGASREQAMQVELAGKLEELFSVYSKAELRDMQKTRNGYGSDGRQWTKHQILAIALNMGNADNINRLMATDIPIEYQLTRDEIDTLLANLDKRDWDFVQSMLDQINSYWPEMSAMELRRTGVAPKKVDAQEIVTKFGIYKGGYYPIKYDPMVTANAALDAKTATDAYQSAGRFGKAQTKNGMLIERKAGGNGRAVLLDMQGAFGHMRDVIRGISMAEAVDNAYRILNDREVRQSFIDAGRANDLDYLMLWLKDTAHGPRNNSDLVNTAARFVKNNFTLARLAFNMKTVLLQVTGLGHSATTVGKRNLARGLAAYMRHMPQTINEAVTKSPFMAERKATFQKDIYDFANDVRMSSPMRGRVADLKDLLAKVGFAPITWTQFYIVDMPTWIAGYQAGLQKFPGNEERAIAYADRMVARSQDSAFISDRSAIARGTLGEGTRQSDFVRVFTTLQGYMITKLNRGSTTVRKGLRGMHSTNPAQVVASASNMAVDLMLLYAFEAAVQTIFWAWLLGDDKDLKDQDLLNFAMGEVGAAVFGGVPFARDAVGALQGYSGGGIYGSVMETPAKVFQQVSQGQNDKALRRAVGDAIGLATGLPSTESLRVIEAAIESDDTGTLPIADMLFGRNPLSR